MKNSIVAIKRISDAREVGLAGAFEQKPTVLKEIDGGGMDALSKDIGYTF